MLLYFVALFLTAGNVASEIANGNGSNSSNAPQQQQQQQPQNHHQHQHQPEASFSHQVVCERHAKCEDHGNLTCFGSSLPYSSTTIELVEDVDNQREVDERLAQWEAGLRQIPRCWAVVQPLLCSLYRPPCKNSSVPLLPSKLCEQARKACRITALAGGLEWPHFLRCEQDIFPKGCKSDMRKIRFNAIQGHCPSPLVPTPDRDSWYPEIDGCGVSCRQHPLVSVDEQREMRTFVACVASVSAACCIFTLLTHLLDWTSSLKYPMLMTVYAAGCLLVVCGGFGAQFAFGSDTILCKKDGTIRHGEPSAKENLACLAVFVACYYFLFAALAWFVLICYAWSASILRLSSRSLSEGYWKSRTAYFHMFAWSVPLVLTIVVIALSEIEADSLTGVCFVSQHSIPMRVAFVVLPSILAVACAAWFLIRLEYKLVRLKNSSMSMLNDESRGHIEKAIHRLGLLLLCMCLMTFVTAFCHIHEFRHLALWRTSLREHFSCRTNVVPSDLNRVIETTSCDLKAKPGLLVLRVHLMVFLSACLVLLAATMNSSAAKAWRRVFNEVVLRKKTESTKTTRNQAIADAFAHAKKERANDDDDDDDDDEDGRIGAADSVSQNLSSTWTNVLPGLPYGVISPMMVSRRYSSTSDVSRRTSKWMQSMARKRKTRKERDRYRGATEKTTSTGDLGYTTVPLLPPHQQQAAAAAQQQQHQAAAAAVAAAAAAAAAATGQQPVRAAGGHPGPLIRKSMVNKKHLINPPFTHGMSGEARENRLCPFRPKSATPPWTMMTATGAAAAASSTSAQGASAIIGPTQTQAQSPSMLLAAAAAAAAAASGVPPPQASLYAALPMLSPAGAHGRLAHLPFAFPGAQAFPLIDPFTGFPLGPYSPYFAPYGMMPAPPPAATEFVPFPDVDSIKSPLIPLRAHETGSEASFRMPLAGLSDTEYDTEAYRPQTAVPRDARQPKSGRLSAPPKRQSGFFST